MSKNDISNILGGPWAPPARREPEPLEVQISQAMAAVGLKAPSSIKIDGKIHRFSPDGKKGDSGWYIIFGDGVAAGRFGCWKEGLEIKFIADVGRDLTTADKMAHTRRMSEAKAARDAEQLKGRQVAANVVDQIWSDAAQATADHPYLARKGVQPNGARVTGDGRLVVPLYNHEGALRSLQYIDHEGGKLYHSGAQTGECYWVIGTFDEPGITYLAEGFATAATIHEVTNRPCIVAYSASNLVPIAGLFSSHQLTIVADNDENGIGQKYAEQASAKYGASVIIPPIKGDANDYAQQGGDLRSLLTPTLPDGIIDKLRAVFGNDLSDDYEAPDELIEGLIVMNSLTVLYGDSNSGKTFLALAMAAAISEGQPFFGKRVDKGLVVYLASEAPGSIRSRMQAIKRFYDCDLANLVMIPVPVNFHAGDGDANDVITLIKEVERLKGQPVRMFIGDTLARISSGANENSGEDMGPVMGRFDRIATETGAAGLIIHHNGKDAAKGSRGWSGIRAHIDTEIEILEKDGVRSANVTKQRELPGKGDAIYFKLEVVEMGITKFGEVATTCVAVHDADGQDAKPHKKPTKHDENVRIMQRAWFASGCEDIDGFPYISRSALKQFLNSNMDWAERTIRNKLDPSHGSSMILPLLTAGIIDVEGHGWVVRDAVQSAAFMMSRGEK